MHEACVKNPGTMSVVIGMADDIVDEIVTSLHMPDDIWTANFNCPGQVVISGSLRGIEAATARLKESGAKRVLPLQVHGAFHSGLMKEAQEALAPHIQNTDFQKSATLVPMNCTGAFTESIDEIKQNLINQVVKPVYWHKSVGTMLEKTPDFFIEIGPGKTLAGMNKRIGVSFPTYSLEKIEDIAALEQLFV